MRDGKKMEKEQIKERVQLLEFASIVEGVRGKVNRKMLFTKRRQNFDRADIDMTHCMRFPVFKSKSTRNGLKMTLRTYCCLSFRIKKKKNFPQVFQGGGEVKDFYFSQ